MKKILNPVSLFSLTILATSFFAGSCAQAQPVISEVKVDYLTDSSVRVAWRIDAASAGSGAYGWVIYGTSPTNLNYSTLQRIDVAPGNTWRAIQFSGLAPATRYYFRPVNRDPQGQVNASWTCPSGGEQPGFECSAAGEVASFVTLPLSSPASRLPQPPETFEVPAALTIDGETFPVAADCANLTAQLAAAVAADTSKNHRVIIPAGTRCMIQDSLTLPRKTSDNWIEVRTSTTDEDLGPPGARVSPADRTKLASLVKVDEGMRDDSDALRSYTACNYYTTGCSQAPVVCGGPYCSRGWRFVGLEITHLSAAEYTPKVLSISSITRLDGGGDTVLDIRTSVPHGFNFFQTVHVSGVHGFSGNAGNGVFTAAPTGPDVFRIRIPGVVSGEWDSLGGIVTKYFALPISEIQAGSPAVVTTTYPHGLTTGALVQVGGVNGSQGINGPHHITVLSDTQFSLNNSTGLEAYTGGGFISTDPAQYSGLVSFLGDSADMVIDRCWIHGQGFPTRVFNGVRMNGVRNALINSTVDDINAWRPVDPATGLIQGGLYGTNIATSTAITMDHGGPLKITNNFINSEGITIFATDGASSLVLPAADIEIRRNHITMDERHRYGSPVSNGLWYPSRHFFEAKKVQRVLFDGNVFENCWADFGQQNGSCFMFTPRVGPRSDPSGSKSVISDIAFTNNVIHRVSSGFTFSGGEQFGDGDTPTTARILIRNNLYYDSNYHLLRTPQTLSPSGGGFLFVTGAEKIRVEHNTVFDNRGTGPAILVAGGTRSAQLVVQNNIFTHHSDGNNGGFLRTYINTVAPTINPALTHFASFGQFWHAAPGPDPNSSFSHNVIIPGVRDSKNERCFESTEEYDCNFSKSAAQAFWAGFPRLYFPDGATARQRMAAVGFESTAHLEGLRLRPDSPYAAGKMCGGAPCSTTGKALGIDLDELLDVTQLARQLDLRQANGTVATVAFKTHPARPCVVEVARNLMFRPSLTSRKTAGDAYREVTFSGLPQGEPLYVRASCSGGDRIQAITGPAALAVRQGSPQNSIPKRIELKISPPPLLGPARAVVDYGATNSLGESAQVADCASGCTVEVPATAGSRIYYRVSYRSPGSGALLAKPGKIQSIVIK